MGRRRGDAKDDAGTGVPPTPAVRFLEVRSEHYALITLATRPGPIPALTESEQAVSAMVLAGHSNAEIARHRQTAVRTVANQLASIFHKLGVRSRVELAALLNNPAASESSR
jgi:DNA-binding CsgD family transcriptional regulator